MTFLTKDYKMPVSTNYFKFKEGKNKFRALSDAVTGWEYWTTEDKPVRQEEPFDDMPSDIKTDKFGKQSINHFWAFIVWSYEAKKAQILLLTQKSIMQAIKTYLDEPDWGDIKSYDIVVNRIDGEKTTYQTIANPPSEFAEKVDISKINLSALFENKDPFGVK